MPALSVPSDPMVGRTIDGRFKTIRLLGEGGMGQVYLAEQTSMGRPVALKVLSPFFDGEGRIKDRFRNEAALASRLNHPSTVVVYDFGVTDDGLMFIAMELIEGKSLRDELDACGAMEWRRAAGIVRQICGSLQDAHEKSIIHRDLKPENIMLLTRSDANDVVKVLDFGVAKILSDNDWQTERGLTAPNEIFGTPEYMSPEQARGDEMSSSTDIYSLGIIMYRMMTGHLPFDGNTPIAILAKHLADPPPKLEQAGISPAIPDELCRLVNSCLAKDPSDRPASMKSLGAAVEQMLFADGESAPSSLVDEPWRLPTMDANRPGTHHGGRQPETGMARGEVKRPVSNGDMSQGRTGRRPAAKAQGSESSAMPPLPISSDHLAAGDGEKGMEEEGTPKQKTLAKLMHRIQRRKDFPAVSQHISELNTKVGNEDTSASQLSNVILKDTSLTARLIKLANSPYYGNTRGQITMVSRAVVLMGFDAVREAALGLLLFDHLQSSDPEQASELRDTAVGALMGAIVAKEQARQLDGINKEEAFICGMFHNLGKQAAIYYLPEEMETIRGRVSEGEIEDKVVDEMLGVSYGDLGKALAKKWDFPDQILMTMEALPPGPLRRPRRKSDRLHHLTVFSSEMVKAAAETDPTRRQYAFRELASRFGGSFKIDADEIATLVNDSLEKLEGYARNMNLRASESTFLKKVLIGAGKRPSIAADDPVKSRANVTRSGRVLRAEGMTDDDYQAIVTETASEELAKKEKAFEEGVAEVAASIKGRFDLNGVMLMVLETMYRGLGLNRVVFCLNDVRTKTLRGRFGFGENVDALIPDFHFSPRGRLDLFSHAMSTGEDTLVVNVPDKPLPLKVPLWYRNLVNSPFFLLFPIRVKQFPAALFYGDLTDSEAEINPVLMEQMRALRDQAVLAMEAANNPKAGRGRR